jgi:hypothetical protein
MFSTTDITKVTLPSGLVDSTGQLLIREKIADYTGVGLPDDWDWSAKVGGRGEYVGTLAKRIGKYVYQNGSKLPSDCLGAIGSIAGEHTPKALSYWYDITDEFDWCAGDYGDDGSCFFGGCRNSARETMLENGALAIRLYRTREDGKAGSGNGRGWIMPKRVGWDVETSDGHTATAADSWVLFNVYGPTSYAVVARILSTIGDCSYRQVSLRNEGARDGHIWINSSGWLIGAEENVNGIHSLDMQIPGGERCADCNDLLDGDGIYVESQGNVCECCAENYFHCSCCDEMHHHDCENEVFRDGCEEYVCDICRERHYSHCNDCGNYHSDNDVADCNGSMVCYKCRTESGDYVECEECGEWTHIDHSACLEDEWLCEGCADNRDYYCCDCCGENREGEPISRPDGADYCPDCDKTHCAECEERGDSLENVAGRYYCSACATEAHENAFPLLSADITD